MNQQDSYDHTQHGPFCWLLNGIGLLLIGLAWGLRVERGIPWVFLPVGLLILLLGGGFHFLRVRDIGEQLCVAFGPIPLFRRKIAYCNMTGVETGRTTILDGWGIHMSPRGGWVWNIWGRDCVVLQLKKGILRIGTDDAERLTAFLRVRLPTASKQSHLS
ncbi:MAG: hypothetical protein WAO83_09725 [Fuerstiella sp.]